ncbi:beta-1,3-galactosyltransferase 5-like, partial [Babylonia areolata]|uniref:beta-1,3-galactosyltransferase 5-like n=1 Tax=Babylonia areolata TaxID=304850 RepID=UPI003FD4068C
CPPPCSLCFTSSPSGRAHIRQVPAATSTPHRRHSCGLLLTDSDTHDPRAYFAPRERQSLQRERTQFLVQPRRTLCSGPLDLLVLVPSHADRGQRRDAIRNTWGSVTLGNPWPHPTAAARSEYKAAVVFVVGRPVTAALKAEAEAHGDVLLVDVDDTYRNLTRKVLAGLAWASTRCWDTGHVAKVDDDMFLNVDLTMHLMTRWFRTSPSPSLPSLYSVLGRIMCSGDSLVFRGNSRLSVSASLYPFTYYPAYVSGGHYILPGPLVPPLVQLSRAMPMLPVEDAHITGVLGRVLHVRHVNLPRLLMEGDGPSPSQIASSCYLSAHNVDSDKQLSIWQGLHRHPHGHNCSQVLSAEDVKTCSQICGRDH